MLSALLRTARFFKTPDMATTWAAEFVDDRIKTPRHRNHLDYYSARQLPVAEGVAQALAIEISAVNEKLENLPEFLIEENKDPGMTIKWSATSELAATTYSVFGFYALAEGLAVAVRCTRMAATASFGVICHILELVDTVSVTCLLH